MSSVSGQVYLTADIKPGLVQKTHTPEAVNGKMVEHHFFLIGRIVNLLP